MNPLPATAATDKPSERTLEDMGAMLGQTIVGHLHEQERHNRALSRLCVGAAFESWLSFETRLLLEERRAEFGWDEALTGEREGIPRYWVGNEHAKIDLSIWDVAQPPGELVLAVEFKLIHNNKNWRGKSDEVWEDLFPSREPKRSHTPRLGRLAVVGIVGTTYRESAGYQAVKDELPVWTEKLRKYLVDSTDEKGRRVANVFESNPDRLCDPWLVENGDSSFALMVLAASRESRDFV